MPDLRWTLPIAAWSSTTTAAPKLDFIDPMVRRRLSTLSKMALWVAHDCAPDHPQIRLIFASRHGELARTTAILRDIEAREPVSPNAFSLSVLNAMSGIYGIARHDRSPATAVAAGAETLGYALLEAHAQWTEDPSVPVLVVYADEPADAAYGHVEHEVTQGALAILLDARTNARGQLSIVVSDTDDEDDGDVSGDARARGDRHVGGDEHVSAPANDLDGNDTDAGGIDTGDDAREPRPTASATQSEALLRCLESGQTQAWHCAGSSWQWSWIQDTRDAHDSHEAHETHTDRGPHVATA